MFGAIDVRLVIPSAIPELAATARRHSVLALINMLLGVAIVSLASCAVRGLFLQITIKYGVNCVATKSPL